MLDLYKAKKKVLIADGESSIGAEAVREFTGLGAEVVFFYRQSDAEAFKLSRETGALNVRCNVSNPESVKAAFEVAKEFLSGEIDVLVCNAGIYDNSLMTSVGIEKWNEIINSDLNSAFYCVSEALPGMIANKKGIIITVSSMQGQVGAAGSVAYSAAKAGLIGMTKALAKETGPSGIRVNCIAPGALEEECDASTMKRMTIDTPLCRKGTAKDIAKTMVFLASDNAEFITGQVIGVNGGLIV